MSVKQLKGKETYWPEKAICPVCRKKKVFEPHTFLVLASYTLLSDRRRKGKISTGDMETSLDLMFHGAHDTGIGNCRDITASVKLADRIKGGQFEIYFCSASCVKKYLCEWVDMLEKKVEKDVRKQAKGIRLSGK